MDILALLKSLWGKRMPLQSDELQWQWEYSPETWKGQSAEHIGTQLHNESMSMLRNIPSQDSSNTNSQLRILFHQQHDLLSHRIRDFIKEEGGSDTYHAVTKVSDFHG